MQDLLALRPHTAQPAGPCRGLGKAITRALIAKAGGAGGEGFPGTDPAGSHPWPCPLLWVKDKARNVFTEGKRQPWPCPERLSQPRGMQPHPSCPSLQGSAAFLGEHRHWDERGCATGPGWAGGTRAGQAVPVSRNPLGTTRRVWGCQPQLPWGKQPDFHHNPCR